MVDTGQRRDRSKRKLKGKESKTPVIADKVSKKHGSEKHMRVKHGREKSKRGLIRRTASHRKLLKVCESCSVSLSGFRKVKIVGV